MSHTYKITVNNTHTFDADPAVLADFDAVTTAPNHYHIIKNGQPYTAEIISADFLKKTYTVVINNNTYEVHLADALDQRIKNMGFETGGAKHVNEINAPIPGLILEISVQPGDAVTENQTLLILEAMKMENTLHSPRAGVIKSIAVTKGQAVDKGQLLIEFE